MGDDCFAVRLADTFTRRFGGRALHLATTRLGRARDREEIVKIDLYVAVTVVLRDDDGVFRRSRMRCPIE